MEPKCSQFVVSNEFRGSYMEKRFKHNSMWENMEGIASDVVGYRPMSHWGRRGRMKKKIITTEFKIAG